MEEFVLGAAVVIVVAKENVAVVEVVAARVTMRGVDGMQADSRTLQEVVCVAVYAPGQRILRE